MPAKGSSSVCRVAQMAALAAVLMLAGCAGGTVFKPPGTPDDSVLAPAEQALAKARAADADTFAPRVVDASRRRIATARDIIYGAARASRPLDDTEQQRVDQLVDAAELDARSALVQTQARAVQTQVEQLQGQIDAGAPGGGRAPAAGASP